MESIGQSADKGQRSDYANAKAQSDSLFRFQLLYERNQKFRNASDHKGFEGPCRRCLEVLIQCAVSDRWGDQEIIAILAAHRRRYNQDPLGDSYFQNIIRKAREAFSRDGDIQQLEKLIETEARPSHGEDGERSVEDPADDDQQRRAVNLKQVSRILGLVGGKEIVAFIRYMSEPREYGLRFADSSLDGRLGGIAYLTNQQNLRDRIADFAGEMIPTFRATEWRTIVQALMDARIDETVGEEATDAGLVNSWLASYLATNAVLDSFDESDETRSPFQYAGRVHIFLERLRGWIWRHHGDRLPARDLSLLLRRAGAEPVKVNGRAGKHVKSARVWQLPQQYGLAPQPETDDPGHADGASQCGTYERNHRKRNNPFSKPLSYVSYTDDREV